MLIQQQLIGSIKYRINLGENKEVIIKSLLDQGCIQQDIDNAFYVIENAQSIAENQLLEAAKESNKKIRNVVKRAISRGLENWQINLKIDKEGISVIDYYKLNLFNR